jgi:hypothetical protein
MTDPERTKLRRSIILCGGLLAASLALTVLTFLAVEILMPITS